MKVNFKSTLKLKVTSAALKNLVKPTSGLGVANLLDTGVLILRVLTLERHTRWLGDRVSFHLCHVRADFLLSSSGKRDNLHKEFSIQDEPAHLIKHQAR